MDLRQNTPLILFHKTWPFATKQIAGLDIARPGPIKGSIQSHDSGFKVKRLADIANQLAKKWIKETQLKKIPISAAATGCSQGKPRPSPISSIGQRRSHRGSHCEWHLQAGRKGGA